MAITDLVAEFVALSRQSQSGPLPEAQRRRWQELKTLLLVAQREPLTLPRENISVMPFQRRPEDA